MPSETRFWGYPEKFFWKSLYKTATAVGKESYSASRSIKPLHIFGDLKGYNSTIQWILFEKISLEASNRDREPMNSVSWKISYRQSSRRRKGLHKSPLIYSEIWRGILQPSPKILKKTYHLGLATSGRCLAGGKQTQNYMIWQTKKTASGEKQSSVMKKARWTKWNSGSIPFRNVVFWGDLGRFLPF